MGRNHRRRRATESQADMLSEEELHELTLQTFAGSALFKRIFDDGMKLVEETAGYLDGPGREEQRRLPQTIALLYAGESMRVTTRLMQVASWLLVQRAVHDGEMKAEEAAGERYRLGSKEICLGMGRVGVEHLPKDLQGLLARSDTLYRQISRLDEVLFGTVAIAPGAREQIQMLEQAFGAR